MTSLYVGQLVFHQGTEEFTEFEYRTKPLQTGKPFTSSDNPNHFILPPLSHFCSAYEFFANQHFNNIYSEVDFYYTFFSNRSCLFRRCAQSANSETLLSDDLFRRVCSRLHGLDRLPNIANYLSTAAALLGQLGGEPETKVLCIIASLQPSSCIITLPFTHHKT